MKQKPIFTAICAVGIFVLCFSLIGCKQKIEVSAESAPADKNVQTPVLNVFIENSGSMDGYMCAGSQLKDAVYDYVSELNRYTEATKLYYINSDTIPYKGSLQSYIKDLDPTKFSKAGGNRSNTDLGNIVGRVLNTVTETTVTIFISDCILDLPSKDAQKFLTNCEITIKEEIISTLKRVPDLGVEILKLTSNFSGRYFYPNGSVETLKDVKRPYYMWIFGKKEILAYLNKNVPLSQLDRYDLKGITSFASLSSMPFEVKNPRITGNVVTANRDGDFQITLLMDLSSSLQPENVILDKNNFGFNGQSLIIEGIYPISAKGSNYTHFAKVTIPNGVKIAQESLTFYSPKIATWVAASNDESGANVLDNMDKTTGILYLIQGVADAYRNEQVLAKFNFKVKQK